MEVLRVLLGLFLLLSVREGGSAKLQAKKEVYTITETGEWTFNATKTNRNRECFKIYWEKPERESNMGEVTRFVGGVVEIKDLTETGIKVDVTMSRMTDDHEIEVVQPTTRIHPKKMKKFAIGGGEEKTYIKDKLVVREGGVRQVSAFNLAVFCYTPRKEVEDGPIINVTSKFRYLTEMYNIHRNNTPKERLAFHVVVGTESRFKVGFTTSLEGILTTQLPDEGFDELVAKVVNTEGWKYRLSLYWGSDGQPAAPVTWRPYEDSNIRLVLPAFDYSQFANNYGYSGSWTGIEWGFYEKVREWVIMDPYGSPHIFTGTQNTFEPQPFAATTPVMLYSRVRPTSMRSLRSAKAAVRVQG